MNFPTCVLQCRPNIEGGERAACPDSVQGGNDNATVLRGRVEGSSRCVEYIRPIIATGELVCCQYCPNNSKYIHYTV